MHDNEQRCLACTVDHGNNAIHLWAHTKHYPDAILYLCDDCLRNATTFAGYDTWSDEMKQERKRLIAKKRYHERAYTRS